MKRKSKRARISAPAVPDTPKSTATSHAPSRLSEYLDRLPPDAGNPRLILLPTRKGFSLAQSICSYGYFGLAPNVWIPDSVVDKNSPAALTNNTSDSGQYSRPLRYGPNFEEIVQVTVSEHRGDQQLRIVLERPITDPAHRKQILEQVGRITRIDVDLTPFHDLHKEAADRGFGRLFRSPTLWEDIVKTITNCNMQWVGTVAMNRQLCSKIGNGSFPTPEQVAAVSVQDLQECRLGYRASFVHKLATSWTNGEIDAAWFEAKDRTRAELMSAFKKLHGIGDFAAANCSQLLGYYETIAYDTESRRLWQEEHDSKEKKGPMSPQLKARAQKYYDQFAPYQFIAYWFELWQNYERKTGKRSTKWMTNGDLQVLG